MEDKEREREKEKKDGGRKYCRNNFPSAEN